MNSSDAEAGRLPVRQRHAGRAGEPPAARRSRPALGRAEAGKSVRTIATLERRLDALEPPPEAERLDELLRQIVREERKLASEFASLARYAPAAAAPLARAAAAGKEARSALGASQEPADQAAALETYAAELNSVVATLRKLKAPPVVSADHRGQIQTYSRIAAASRTLADALRGNEGVAAGVRGLQRAVASSSTLRAQRARAASVRSFNRRVAHVKLLAAKAQRERLRVQPRLSDG